MSLDHCHVCGDFVQVQDCCDEGSVRFLGTKKPVQLWLMQDGSLFLSHISPVHREVVHTVLGDPSSPSHHPVLPTA